MVSGKQEVGAHEIASGRNAPDSNRNKDDEAGGGGDGGFALMGCSCFHGTFKTRRAVNENAQISQGIFKFQNTITRAQNKTTHDSHTIFTNRFPFNITTPLNPKTSARQRLPLLLQLLRRRPPLLLLLLQ